jgi:hypothetical protein
MMFYTIKSEGMPAKQPVMAKVEEIFLAKFHYYREIGNDVLALKYLHYYNDVVELRNRTEYGL